MKTRLFIMLNLAACMLFSLFPMTTLAQITPDVAEGLTPYQSFNGGNIDAVNLSNGNVLIRIPIFSYPQRGNALKWNKTYVDNTKVAASGQICVGTSGCYYEWDASPPNSVPVVFDALVDDQSVSYRQTYYTLPKLGQWAAYAVVSADGAVHPIDLNPTATNYETMDATGFTANPSGTDWLTAPTLIVDRNGNRFQSLREDTNGNELFTPALPYGDTVGRLFPNGTATTDYSGCAGPLPTTSAYNLTLPGPNNGSVTYKFCDATLTVNIPATETPGVRAYTSTNPITQCIVLPNGTTWIFAYNDRNPGDPSSVNFGIPTTITLPTGGTINYTFTTIQFRPSGTSSWSRWVATRTVNANDGTGPHTWTYTYANVAQTTSTTTVTDPLGNNTIHTFAQVDGYRETQTQIYQLINGVQTLQKTVVTAYKLLNGGSAYYPCVTAQPQSVTTIWPNNQETQVQTDYDSEGSGGFWSYGNLIAKREYAYGTGAPGALLRTTTIKYQALSNSYYLANNLLDLKSSVQITDGGGTQRAYTTYGYDAYSSLAPSGITTQHDANPPAGTYRGNLTSVAKWLNTTGGYLTTTTHYFDTGEVQTVTDPNLNTTTYAYSSTYTGSLPTAVTNALNQTSNYGYDFNTGKLTSAEDPNNQTSSYTYDSMFRLAAASYPDGGSASITHQETTFPFSATLSKKITASQNRVETNVFDGLGRVSENQLTDPEGTIYSDRTYDADGRIASVSNPYRTTSDPTYGITFFVYDALGRTCVVVPPDGTAVSGSACPASQPSNDVFTTYAGNQTTVTDQAGITRRSQTDGLGRLTNVWESPSGVNFQTTYTYDVLDDLASVIQGTSHNRTFVYDSLKRLTSSQNPETGTTPVLYTYDANGNVVTKTDARGTIINYSPTSNPIDQLNRVTSKTYSDGTPTVVYYYDGNAPSACSLGGFTYTNAIGRRTAMCDADGSEFWSYDPMGREKVEQRTTNSITKTTSYLYDFNGDLATLTYPSGRVMTYTTDSAGRPSEAQDIPNNIFYMQGTCSNGINSLGVCYAPQSAIASANIGPTGGSTWLKAAMTYNDRLQPNEIQYLNQAGNLMLLQYSFVDASSHNNGNVMAITNLVDDTRSQQFTYDQLNRLLTADTTSTYSTSPSHCWGEAYVYDNSTNTPGEFGNLTNINVPSTAYNGCTIESSLSLVANAANQITTFSYDASGNTLNDTHNSYTWYAESELKTAAGVTYTYDGDGNRLQKSNGKIYWYGAGTEVLDESDASGNITDEYVYFGGTRVSHRVASTNALYFYGADMLGTSRTIFTSAGVLCYDADFYPFGGERAYTNTCTQNYKFEGKERDTETNNDDFGARYYSSAFGRWTSPDWSAIPEPVPYANLANPQTLNLYGIARDNPETFAELDGHCIEDACVGEIFMLAVVTTTYLQSPQGQQNLNVVASGIAAAISSIFQRNGTGSSGGDTEGRRFTPDQRQQGKGEPCAYCGQKTTEEPGHPNSRETDHVNPKAQGGNTTPENTADACRTCNRQKGNRTPEQWKNGEKPPQPKPQQTQQPQEPQPPPVPQPTQQPPPNPPPPAPLTPDPIGP